MSLLMILLIAITVGFFLIIVAIRDDHRDRRIREYKAAVRLMSAYFGRPCVNLARDLADLIKSKKGD